MISDEELRDYATTHLTSPFCELAKEVLEYREFKRTPCRWNLEMGTCGTWLTACGDIFVVEGGDSTPSENGVKFCPYCGYRIEESGYEY